MRRIVAVSLLVLAFLAAVPAAAFACGGLVAARHAEVLRRATTLAAWAGGVEHYITGFEFAGSAESFGYIIPLPAAPSKIVKGGDWTLERLEREAFPQRTFGEGTSLGALHTSAAVAVIQHVVVDSLDIKVVRGGGADVAAWAREHGFDLTADTDAVLASYKSNTFALAKFDKAGAAKRFIQGQGVVIDFEIPLPGPWIPLRILALGKQKVEQVDAHLFLLTPEKPVIYPAPPSLRGMRVAFDGPASDSLIGDLRSDKGTAWVPTTMWLTALDLSAPASSVRYDLSAISGGIIPVAFDFGGGHGDWAWYVVTALLVAGAILFVRRAPASARPA